MALEIYGGRPDWTGSPVPGTVIPMTTKTATANALRAVDAIRAHKDHAIPTRFAHTERCDAYLDACDDLNRAMLVIANADDREARRVVSAYQNRP